MTRTHNGGLLTVLLVSLAACGGTETPTEVPVATTVTLSSTTVTFSSFGETEQLTATVSDQNGATMSGASVTWASSASSVAGVSSTGLVTAVSNGPATITATSGSATETASVTVQQVAASITLSPGSLVLAGPGDSATVTASVIDAGGSEIGSPDLTWSSENSGIATVSNTGLVTAVSAGEALITVEAASGRQSVTDQTTVTVVPPFSGTVYIDPDIITSSDPTAFQSLSFAGQGSRTMFDRRVNGWITVNNAYLFNASFDDGLTAEIQVNPEFGSSETARAEAQKYAEVIGRLPTVLRTDVETVWIHKGIEAFGGGNSNLLIHTGSGELSAANGILEETFVHEAAHTSLDAAHASAPGWLAAQSADPTFISTYARDNPNREDIAESFLVYLAVRYRSDRISQSLANTILLSNPNRIAYFDDHILVMGTGW